MSQNNIKEFLSNERNLGKVIRFSADTRIKDETVAEHSYHVALYSMILADLEQQFGNKVNKERLMKAALIHDLEECLTGDIIYDFKHSNEKLAEEIKKMGGRFYQKLVS